MFSQWFERNGSKLRLGRAKLYLAAARAKLRASSWANNHSPKIRVGAWLLALVAAVTAIALSASWLRHHFGQPSDVAALRDFLVALGSAFVGGTAITASFVLFAMQVNVERLPHGLFHRLSADTLLLAVFAASFALAVGVASSSLLPEHYLPLALPGSIVATVVVLKLFLVGYRRALGLISPTKQLERITLDVQRNLRRWSGLADAGSLVVKERLAQKGHQVRAEDYDSARIQFFDSNPFWDASVLEGLKYAFAIARRSAAVGDHASAQRALAAVLSLNTMYVTAKKRTFINANPFVDNPRTTDRVINATLEDLRQMNQSALAQRDETLCGLTMRSMGGLVGVYVRIEYPHRDRTKSHATLATGYLQGAVEQLLPVRMTDPLMEGVSVLGTAASVLIAKAKPNDAVPVAQLIGSIGGSVGPLGDLRPVMQTSMEQLARLSLFIIRSPDFEDYSASRIRKAGTDAAIMFVRSAPASNHQGFLKPYYSSTTQFSLQYQLGELAEAIADRPEGDAAAARAAHHLAVWIDDPRQDHDLLQAAVELRSPFVFDALRWIGDLSLAALVVSASPACRGHDQEQLRTAARRLASHFLRLPEDPDAANLLDIHGVDDVLYELAIQSFSDDYREVSDIARRALLRLAVGPGAIGGQWHLIEQSLTKLVAITLGLENDEALIPLYRSIERALADFLALEPRQRAAVALRQRADQPFDFGDANDELARNLAGLDRDSVRDALRHIANLLAPEPA